MAQGHSINSSGLNMVANTGRLLDSYAVRGPGAQAVIPAGASDSVTVVNSSSTWVRGTVTPAPGYVVTGNASFAVGPGMSQQFTFGDALIASINFVGVDMPAIAGTTSVAALVANAQDYLVEVGFLES